MIYLDNASTTQLDHEVLQAMLPYMMEEYGNPGSIHTPGRNAKEAVDKARKQVADFIGTTPGRIVFTSSGSEANTLAVSGMLKSLKLAEKNHIILSGVEHKSLMKSVAAAETEGFEITVINPLNDGTISPTAVEREIRQNTGLVSIMYANNETGFVNDIAAIGRVCRAANVIFHSDCVQAAGQYDISVDELSLDLASISAHKIHGPKGVGALYVGDAVFELLMPQIFGGDDQEFGLRGGTENVPAIVGFGAACEIASREIQANILSVNMAKQEFVHALVESVGGNLKEAGITVNGNGYLNPGKVLNLRIDGVSGETLVLMMGASGICVSAGSACNSHESVPSHVLRAHGLTDDQARSSIRISFSKNNTVREARQAGMALSGCISVLRSAAGI